MWLHHSEVISAQYPAFSTPAEWCKASLWRWKQDVGSKIGCPKIPWKPQIHHPNGNVFFFCIDKWTVSWLHSLHSPQKITEFARALTDFWMPWSLRLSASNLSQPFGLTSKIEVPGCAHHWSWTWQLGCDSRRSCCPLRCWWGIPAPMAIFLNMMISQFCSLVDLRVPYLETKPYHRLVDKHHRLPFWGGFLAQHFAAKYSPRVRFGACHFCQLRWHPKIGTAQVAGAMQLICLYLCFRVTSWYVNALANSNQTSQDS